MAASDGSAARRWKAARRAASEPAERPRREARLPALIGRRSGTGGPLLRSPIWSCSAWGLPCLRRRRRSGALLPHHFTLTRPLAGSGRYLSVALSVASPRLAVSEHAARGSSDFPLRP